MLCPYREHSRLSILSYAAASADGPQGLLLQERAEGLVLAINGHEIATGLHLDYHQWQHIALTWRSSDGRFEFYKEDGVAAVVAMVEGRSVDFGPPAFTGTLAVGERLPDGGCLVVGQEQGRPGMPAAFVPGTGFVGGLRTVRLWDRVLDRSALNRFKAAWLDGDEPGLAGCWCFTRRGLEIGECLNACSATVNVGLIGGLTPASLRDVNLYRPLVIGVDRTMAGRRPLAASVWQYVAVSCRGRMDGVPAEPALAVDGRPVPLRPVAAEDAPPPLPPHFRIGPMSGSLLADLRLRNLEDGALLAHYVGDRTGDGRLHDRSERGMHLSVAGDIRQEALA
ncbi:hypothetical protein ACIU1J_00420 [Azospirillum doebereinerae]|uniref:hypothetical protein n=1 Tax=Azospirillum doebereinerae TaxID=92933 RepID=UPI00384B5E50